MDGVTRFQQLLSGPGDVIWATGRGEAFQKVGAALPSRRDTPPLSPLPWDLEVAEKCYLMGFPSPTLPGNPWAVASPLLHIPSGFHDWARPVHPAGSKGFFRSNVRVVGVVLLPFDVGGFSLSRKQTLTVVSAHRNQRFRCS